VKRKTQSYLHNSVLLFKLYQVAPNREQLGITATRMRCPHNEGDAEKEPASVPLSLPNS